MSLYQIKTSAFPAHSTVGLDVEDLGVVMMTSNFLDFLCSGTMFDVSVGSILTRSGSDVVSVIRASAHMVFFAVFVPPRFIVVSADASLLLASVTQIVFMAVIVVVCQHRSFLHKISIVLP